MVSTPAQQLKFLEEYSAYVKNVLEPTQLAVKNVLSSWKRPEYWKDYSASLRAPAPSPVQRHRVRIKRPESVADKITRRGETFPHGLDQVSFKTMSDALGARLIVYFTSQLNLIDRELREGPHFDIAPHSEPIAYLRRDMHEELGLSHITRRDKESGYASIHYVLRLKQSATEGGDNPWFELQLRTLCEDIWGEVEHILGYKPLKRTSVAVRKQFRIISRTLEVIDDHFNFLFEELGRFQEEAPIEATDPLNAENLPPVLSDLGLGCAQNEVDSILKILASRKIATVDDLRTLASDKRIAVIRNTYRSTLGREPNNFEMAANLANIVGVTRDSEIAERVKAQIEFLRLWTDLNK
jgi:putative GTP pyrophosphokinase